MDNVNCSSFVNSQGKQTKVHHCSCSYTDDGVLKSSKAETNRHTTLAKNESTTIFKKVELQKNPAASQRLKTTQEENTG